MGRGAGWAGKTKSGSAGGGSATALPVAVSPKSAVKDSELDIDGVRVMVTFDDSAAVVRVTGAGLAPVFSGTGGGKAL